jgi:hypothetical protein
MYYPIKRLRGGDIDYGDNDDDENHFPSASDSKDRVAICLTCAQVNRQD